MTYFKNSQIFLGLGSNLGDREAYLQTAIKEIEKIAKVRKISSIWESPPWGKTDQPAFLNLVIQISTALSPTELLSELKSIERLLGRTPHEKWGPREIDIDILFWNDFVLTTPKLTIPHPYWQERAFVILPLAEIAPEFTPPASPATISDFALVLKHPAAPSSQSLPIVLMQKKKKKMPE